MFNIKENLKKTPKKPGVYLMRDIDENIIYVGKAKNLKNRLSSYFQKSENLTPKTVILVSNIARFEYIVCDTEVEALVLENNLIKKHMPKYNIRLKDDKTYPYLKITNESFPRVIKVRKVAKDKAKYFGPYTEVVALNEVMELVYKIWKIRTCTRNLPRDIGKKRPCLNYYIGKCDAPCAGYIKEEKYKQIIKEVVDFLEGRDTNIVKELKAKMEQASEKMEYEKALEYKEKLDAITKFFEKQKVVDIKNTNKDFIGIHKNVVNVFFIRNGSLIGKDEFIFDIEDEEEIAKDFVKQFYFTKEILPKQIYLEQELEEKIEIEQILSEKAGRKVEIIVPIKGENKKILNLAKNNSKIKFDQIKSKDYKLSKVKEEFKNIFSKEVQTIEAFDISNISGSESVASLVYVKDYKFDKSGYRKFKIKTIEGADDYGSIEEVIYRRFTGDEKDKRPDVILIDGGKGQISAVKKSLKKAGINIPVAGMIKDDKHRTRGLIYDNEIVDISSYTLNFITRVQDEVHRFAINYHRSLMLKKQKKSALDEIEGIGPKKKMLLIKHFKSIKNIKAAGIDDLEAIIDKRAAKSVYEYFRGNNND